MRQAGSVRIPTRECWELLEGSSFGRMSLSVPTVPVVLPVRYYVSDAEVSICMGSHRLPDDLTGMSATLCADSIDDQSLSGWTVEVHGPIGQGCSANTPRACEGTSAGTMLLLLPRYVVGYRMQLCPFNFALQDLISRFGTAPKFDLSSNETPGDVSYRPCPGTATDVLVVEFQDALRETTADILRSEGASVQEAESAETAELILRTNDVRLVLLEPDLPLGSAVDVLGQIENLPPVVVFSSRRFSADEQKLLGDNVVCCLEKPVPPRMLIDVVSSLLDPGGN